MQFLHAILFTTILFAPISQNTYSDGWNKKSTLTIDHPVEIPGMVLQPGTYIVKLDEGTSRRSLVQVLSADSAEVIARLAQSRSRRQRTAM